MMLDTQSNLEQKPCSIITMTTVRISVCLLQRYKIKDHKRSHQWESLQSLMGRLRTAQTGCSQNQSHLSKKTNIQRIKAKNNIKVLRAKNTESSSMFRCQFQADSFRRPVEKHTMSGHTHNKPIILLVCVCVFADSSDQHQDRRYGDWVNALQQLNHNVQSQWSHKHTTGIITR